MRPITLRLNGLRSYLTEQVIDFSDVDLMAIVGDTGAGKSSLLEALCVALYGCCTWDARGAKPLIADAATTLQVELTFRVGDRTWRVTRAISRGAYPPAIHLLQCLDDGTRVDNGDPVNAAIRRLIGLDFSTFLKAVVLPQGRFQILLQMSNTDRTPILRSILGLDQLTTVREAALELAGRLRPRLTALEQRRAQLLADPGAAARDSRRRLKTATASVAMLDGVRKKIAETRTAQTAARTRADAAESAAKRIAEATVADATGTYDRLLKAESELAAARMVAQDRVNSLEDDERALQATLDDAEHAGVGIAQLATASAIITSIIGELPEIAEARAQWTTEQAAIASDREALASRRDTVSALEAEAQQADEAVTEADMAATTAKGKFDSAQTALAGARSATQAAADAMEKAATLATLHEQRTQEAADADTAARSADEARAAAAAHLDAVRRSAAAAHAASASHAGEPCPICDRVLPDGFVAPQPPGEQGAKSACTAAEEEAKSRARMAASAAANASTASAALGAAREEADACERRRVAALELAARLLGPANLDDADDVLLAEANRLLSVAESTLTDANAHAQAKRVEVTRVTAELRAAEQALARRDTALTTALTALERREQKLRETVARLPTDFRVDEPYLAGPIHQQLARVKQRQQKIAGIADRRADTQASISQARDVVQGVDTRSKTEIDGPRQQLRRRVERLAERVAEACSVLEEQPPPGPPQGTLDDEAKWARGIVTTATHIAGQVGTRAQAEATAAEHAAEDVAAAFASASVEDDKGLEDRLVNASTDRRIAASDLETAETQAPIAADLDGRISVGAPFIDTLDELVRLLADGKFLGAVVKRKQRALLGVASELLSDMTAQRFGFAEGFQIVDRLSGQPRDVKTLSGGETFLASLALALALVELAGRGGGRLDALFLDEGFGSLDANSLAEALDALGRQAEGGRLVAVISHLHAVAENIEHVLLVTEGPHGSEVHWARDVEREALIVDELQSGLLA